ncbi:ribosomal protein S18-alanine N-acetyltransferase [Dactylosporangium sp. NPDC048998]|uniref:ribosomal protein S18-alanine N-acetyltransferase n=1 Tax=Dactylosporangium sp. NPDC048998 TaxID=3363976 RepID=UPI003715ECD6
MLAELRWFHIEELLPIEDELFGEERWSAGMFWNELANGHHYLVALDRAAPPAASGGSGGDAGAGRIVGYGGLAVAPPDEAWIQNIGVRKDAQRRGIGRLLLEALLDEAERRGVRQVLLEVAVDNAPAQKLYAQYGFEAVGIRRGYYQPSNTDALVMMREHED